MKMYFSKTITLILTITFLSLTPIVSPAKAQTLMEMQTVVAIASELNPAIRLPRGSLRAVDENIAQVAAQYVTDHENYQNWEAYTAGGVIMNLQAGFAQQIATNFAAAGFFPESQEETQVDGATHTRYTFTDGISSTLLYVVRSPAELIWFIAEAK